jgi:hypothetical protein
MDDALTLLRAGAANSEIRKLEGGAPFLVVPHGHSIQSLEFLLERPMQRRANIEFFNLTDFVEYAHNFRQPNTVAMWFKKSKSYHLVVILDYHEAGIGTECELARSWQHQCYMNFSRKEELSKSIKLLNDKSKITVLNCEVRNGPYLSHPSHSKQEEE